MMMVRVVIISLVVVVFFRHCAFVLWMVKIFMTFLSFLSFTHAVAHVSAQTSN